MNTILALLAFSPFVQCTQGHPTEPPVKKRVFTPFEQAFTIVQGGKKVDSIALYLIDPGPFDWKGRRENFTGWKNTVLDTGGDLRKPVATFDRRRFAHTFDEPGIYALAFFHDGQEEWKRHFFFFDSKWSDPRYEYQLNLTLFPADPNEDNLTRSLNASYHSAYN